MFCRIVVFLPPIAALRLKKSRLAEKIRVSVGKDRPINQRQLTNCRANTRTAPSESTSERQIDGSRLVAIRSGSTVYRKCGLKSRRQRPHEQMDPTRQNIHQKPDTGRAICPPLCLSVRMSVRLSALFSMRASTRST